jgi:hypothetical protein
METVDYSSGYGQNRIVYCCEYDNELLGSINCVEFLKECAPWS